jgi:hypothetical protein
MTASIIYQALPHVQRTSGRAGVERRRHCEHRAVICVAVHTAAAASPEAQAAERSQPPVGAKASAIPRDGDRCAVRTP